MAFYSYSPKEECQFVHNVKGELDTYQQKNLRRSVLLFPPLPSRLRYLIHRTVEDQHELATFSVGQSWRRRVVVCHSELRGEVEEEGDLDSSNSSYEMEGYAKPKSSIPLRSRGPKRPEKALYMPRAVRERLSTQNSQCPSGDQESPDAASSSCGCSSGSCDCSCPETTEKSSPTSRPESFPSVEDGVLNHVADSSALCPQGLTLQETEPLDQTVSSFADMTLEEDEDKEGLDSGPYRDLTEEIKAHLKEAVMFSIEHADNDYSMYENVNINPDEFRHVIEIYNFPPLFKTDDLLDAFTDYSDGGMKIKWIDDTHALGIFASESAALNSLSICHPLLKARELAKGSKKAKGKAIRQAEFIQPVKERPRTNCAVAQRMVTRALGLQGGGRVQRY